MSDITVGMLLLAAFFSVALGAATLWAACRVYNRLARSDGQFSVAEPTPGKAIGIAVLTVMVCWGIEFILEQCNIGPYSSDRATLIQMHLASAVFQFLVMAVLVSLLLPTTPRRAILVVLLQIAMEIVVVVVIVLAYAIATMNRGL